MAKTSTKTEAAASGRTFRVLNRLSVPAPTSENKRAERSFDVGDTISEADIPASAVKECIEHGDIADLEHKTDSPATPATEE